jgi:hypothetical protein
MYSAKAKIELNKCLMKKTFNGEKHQNWRRGWGVAAWYKNYSMYQQMPENLIYHFTFFPRSNMKF